MRSRSSWQGNYLHVSLIAAFAACSSSSTSTTGGTDAAADHASKEAGSKDTGAKEASSPETSTATPDATSTDSAASDAAHVEASAKDAAATETGAKDAGAHDASAKEAATSDGPVSCGSASPTDVYVDGSKPANGIGTVACPFQTIAAALTYVGTAPTAASPSTVHVAAGAYTESNLTVNPYVTLTGPGPSNASITGSSTMPCASNFSCAITVAPGGTLDGFEVTYPTTGGSHDAVVGGMGSGGTLVPAVLNVTATSKYGRGFVATASMDLGPGVNAIGNFGNGLELTGYGNVHVIASAADAGPSAVNHFDNNGGNGIDVSGGATLQFDGGTANGNGNSGIRLGGMALPPSATIVTHTITGLTATNETFGVSVYPTYAVQTVTIRSSTLLANKFAGLYYDYGTTPFGPTTVSPLDIGTGTSGASAGNNVFAQTGMENAAGIILCHAPLTQVVDGDTFKTCPPTVNGVPSAKSATVCGSATPVTTYADIEYSYLAKSPPDAGPITAADCTP